jgi:hypothetical protein
MVSSGMLRRVALARSDVSEEPGASFIRVTRIGELGTTKAATSNRRKLRRNTSYFHPEEGGARFMLTSLPFVFQLGLILKNGVFWDDTPCGYCKNRRFGGT